MKKISHPFGNALRQHLSRKHGLSQNLLARNIDQIPAVISNMCKGKRLTGPRARSRVLAIIDWLHQEDVLDTREEADALLSAAGMSALRAESSDIFENSLIQKLRDASHQLPPANVTPNKKGLVVETQLNNSYVENMLQIVAEKTHQFVGRSYIFAAIEHFIEQQPCGYMTISGEPGIGKSAIIAEYVRRTRCIAHFNIQTLGITTVAQFLENVCTQIIDRYQLSYNVLPDNATQDGEFFAQLLHEVGVRLSPRQPLIIAIDALDEVETTSSALGGNILYLPTVLPKNIYILMTRRPVILPLVVRSAHEWIKVEDFRNESIQDVQVHLQNEVERPRLHAWIKHQGLHVDTFITILTEKSEQNFMYLRYVLNDIERGVYQDLHLTSLPTGLEGYYNDHWRRMGMNIKPIPRVKIKIVYVLAEVRRPVSRQLIAEVTAEDELSVQEVLDEWSQFLHTMQTSGQARYSVYHTSFRDFLHRKEVVDAAGVTIKEINALISNNFWAELFGDDALH